MKAVARVLALIAMCITFGAAKCESSRDRLPEHGNDKSKAPNMLVNGRTKITKHMVGEVYTTKGPIPRDKARGLGCEWRVIKADGTANPYRHHVANGPMSVKFKRNETGGYFESHYCRLWVRLVYKQNGMP